MTKVQPKKKLGQHFLINLDIAKRIVDSLHSDSDSCVIEVGPGTGVLTKFLIDRFDNNFYAVEVDKESIGYLQRFLPENAKNIIHGDFLKTDITSIVPSGSCAVIGNFPYYISSQILFKIIDNRHIVHEVVCMLQKEVAERICSPPGSKQYGILSVFLQAYYKTEYLFTVNEGNFNPPPKIKSGVIRLSRTNEIHLPCNEKLFFKLVKMSFNQRRKMLRSSLRSILLNLSPHEEIFTKRPEQLSVNEFIELTNLLDNKYGINCS